MSGHRHALILLLLFLPSLFGAFCFCCARFHSMEYVAKEIWVILQSTTFP